MYEHTLRPLLSWLSEKDAEQAHEFALRALGFAERHPRILETLRSLFRVESKTLGQRICGIPFPNPVGLAAGFDKNATALLALEALGFGFIEVGTVLPNYGQPGNLRPRLFRLPKDKALVNRMGFNSDGVRLIKPRLEAYRDKLSIPIGISLGKLKETPNERAHEDYAEVFDQLHEFGDYFVLNVSSPNTPGLRELQERRYLRTSLQLLREIRRDKESAPTRVRKRPKPILVKVAPDLTWEAFDQVIEVAEECADGLILVNTTIRREELSTSTSEAGGLSGRPLFPRAVEMVAYTHRHAPRIPLIGVGGVDDYDSYRTMREAGASLVQVFTGFIYKGPGLPKQINQRILEGIAPAAPFNR